MNHCIAYIISSEISLPVYLCSILKSFNKNVLFLLSLMVCFSVTDTIEDAIRFILSNIAYDIGSTSTDDYLMKVHGLSEYFEK